MILKLFYLICLVVVAFISEIKSQCINTQEVKWGNTYFSVMYQTNTDESPSMGIKGSRSNIKVEDTISIRSPFLDRDFDIDMLCMDVKNAMFVDASFESKDPGPTFNPDGSCAFVGTALSIAPPADASGPNWQTVCIATPITDVAQVHLRIVKNPAVRGVPRLRNLSMTACVD